jgi:hypothetical protein
MRLILLIAFVMFFITAHAQIPKYRFNLAPNAVNLLDDSERDSVLLRLDGFLVHKNEGADRNPFVDKDYAKTHVNPFELFVNVEYDYNNINFYRPTVLTILPVIKHEQYLIKISYQGVTPQNDAKQGVIYTVMAEKRNNDYYFFNSIDYNIRHWNKRQVGSIQYIYPNKLNIVKARQMDEANKALAKRFSVPVIPVIYYRCDDPEQLLKMMGFDYIANMYFSTSGGFAQPWNHALLAGNNSELYVHELVHFYTDKLFKHNNRIINEGYATYLGGTGEWSLEQAKQFARNYLDKNPNADIIKVFTNFDRIQYNIPITYIISGLICKDIEARFGFEKIKELFQAENDEQYFKLLQNVTGISREQFPDYAKRLVYK